jgi:hypothetical protein
VITPALLGYRGRTTPPGDGWQQLVHGEAVLPDQLAPARPVAARLPEGALLRAVLDRAIADIRLGRQHRQRPEALAVWRDAAAWMAARSRESVFDFEEVCDVLDENPAELRRVWLAELPPPRGRARAGGKGGVRC